MITTSQKPRWFFLIATLAFASVASPARADFVSALSAYESGARSIAYQEFRRLEEQGDKRAQRFLERMRMGWPPVTTGWLTAPVSSANTAPEHSGQGPESIAQREAQSSPFSWQIWNPFQQWVELRTASGIVVPTRRSTASKIFYFPADSTMIGLQYAAQSMHAYEAHRELRIKSREGGDFIFGILAAIWWFLTLRVLHFLGHLVRNTANRTSATRKKQAYG